MLNNFLISSNFTKVYHYLSIALLSLLFSCSKPPPTLFTKLEASKTGIDFKNINIDTDSLSIIDYLYYYNGAGVATGDINNDGLPDIYFTSNTNGNKLYLNKGGFTFEDITATAGVAGKADWTTGVAMADVNGDGYLDIYVSTVSHHSPHLKNGISRIYFPNSRNQLFINNRNNTFTESAAQWGIALEGYNTNAVFFDYDRDGDLDLFQLQHSTHQPDAYGPSTIRNKYSEASGGKLFRNEGDHFTNLTKEAGIISSALGYGLGVAVTDFNHDGYDDIYVGNDFHENDYYYINQGDGSFKEMNTEVFGHESRFSMGNDAADINNDGWADIMTLDMLPEDETVLKSSLGDDPLDTYLYQRSFGYHHQYSRNCLQLNTGQGKKFSDIALYSGVAATDWSWSMLIADYDLDGQQDIFVTNGVKNRPNDLDFVKFISALPQDHTKENLRAHDREILEHQPPGAWHNYIFKGRPDLIFGDSSKAWGFGEANLSQGAAYADLDGDGDLDLVTNNINEPAGIYSNNTRQWNRDAHHLTLSFKGPAKNSAGIGVKAFLFANGKMQYRQLQPSRGFMSSVEPALHFGLGQTNKIDSLIIIWPNNRMQTVKSIAVDQSMVLTYDSSNATPLHNQADYIHTLLRVPVQQLFTDITSQSGINFRHRENTNFTDFNKQWYLPHELSTLGPKTAVDDVNGDGLDDFYIGGARSQAGAIYLQQPDAGFVKSKDTLAFIRDRECEDVDAAFFDANGDGYPDLYVASGGNEYSGNTPLIADRLYLNDGKGNFTKSTTLPALYENKSVVCAGDYDSDGDVDVFTGGRADARSYGNIPTSYLLENDGKGNFTIVTEKRCPELAHIGMVTGAAWTDADKDGWLDLAITGEWMTPMLFKNEKGKLRQQNITGNDKALRGWWTALQVTDVNGDGWDDILLGNYGLNSKLKGDTTAPLRMYVADVAGNNKNVQILAVGKQGNYYPFLGKENLENQLPYLKNEYLSYSKMAGKTVKEIFGDRLQNATLFEANCFASVCLLNNGKGQYTVSQLPTSLQWSPVFAFAGTDFNKDGKPDLLTGGNFYGTMPYEGRYDAMALQLCTGNGKGIFHPAFPLENSLAAIEGEVRDIKSIRLAGGRKALLVAINNQPVKLLEY
ncbi:MAG: VCBS repeat-containing protein [Agriterribacter sp.]